MKIVVKNQEILFQKIPLLFSKRNIENVFFQKNNKSLKETFGHKRYVKLYTLHGDKYINYHSVPLGNFLQILKEAGDNEYRKFLNAHGDNRFCEFKITSNFLDRGLYCYAINGIIKYVGRCTDSFSKRINAGYGKIHPKNCFKDGQSTNCHINSLVNSGNNIEFGIYIMNQSTKQEINQLENLILISGFYEWNVALQNAKSTISFLETTEISTSEEP